MEQKKEWLTMVVHKYRGGRAIVTNNSQRGLFVMGDVYYNHRLRSYPDNSILNVVIRLSEQGRRMVQEILYKYDASAMEK